MRTDKFKKYPGIAFPVVILVVMILSVMAVAIGTIGIANLQNVEKFRDSTSSFYAAKAGLAKAMERIYNNPDWITGFNQSPLTSVNGTYTITFDKSGSYYSVNNLNGSGTVAGWAGISIPVGYCYIISTGAVNNVIQRVGVMAKAVTFAPLYPWRYAAFGDERVTIKGEVVSYDSNSDLPPYPPDPTLLYDLPDADIGTNGIDPSSIDLSQGSPMIYGDIMVGQYGSASTAINPADGTGHIADEGIAQVLENPVLMPSVIDNVGGSSRGDITSSGEFEPGKYGTINVASNSTIVLKSGEYSFSSISVGGNASIGINIIENVPVKIYVSGPVNIAGNSLVNSTQLPSKFQIFGTNLCASVSVSGSSDSYYVIYAPSADINVSGGAGLKVFGSLVGKKVTVSGDNIKFYYDKALYGEPGPNVRSGYLEVTTWQNVY